MGDASELPERDLAGALHEVSNALTVVLGWLECAQEELAVNDVARRAVDIAMSHAKLGRRLARRAIGDDSDTLAEEADLETLVRDVVTGVEREALRRHITLSVNSDFTSRTKLVKGAPGLFQVMTNLLLNAIAMSPEGSTVTVETRAVGDAAHVAVIDSGPGVEPSRRAALFDGGNSTRAGGAGVGLRHAHALATSHGGMLCLGESERGARFEASWPLIALKPPMARISTFPNMSLEGVQILLLEDDDAVIGLLSTALSLRGASVHAARTPSELQSAIERQKFDAALLDLSPIASDISAALANVHAHSPSAKVVLISGSATDVPAAAQGLMAAWVRKPFEVGEILAVLRSVRGG
jgi:CheY-like chemotaxis protein/anti-sigma regulatory factor (Ser/Thr protein kinase)